MTRPNPQPGFTLIEIMVVMTLFVMILAGVLVALNTYQDVYFIQDANNKDQEEARRCMEAIKADLQEASFPYVFTDYWAGGNPRATLYDVGYRRCVSASCPWTYKTSPPFAYLYPNRYLWYYKWTMGDTLCPICGSGSSLSVYTDALVIYSARDNPDLGRNFLHLDDQGAPVWRSLIFYFIYYDVRSQRSELRRAQLYLSDIDPSPTRSFGDLLTFTEGNSHQHLSLVGGRESANGPYYTYAYLHRMSSDGTKQTYFYVRIGSFYTTNAYIYTRHPMVNNGAAKTFTFNRQQTTIGTHVVDADFSTSASNSVAGTVIEPASVRVTLAVQSTPGVRGELRRAGTSKVRPVTTVLCTALHPRN